MENIHQRAEDNGLPKQDAQASTHPIASIVGRLVLGGALAALALMLFLKLADEVMETETMRFDTAAINYFLHHDSPAVHTFMEGVTWIGSGPIQSIAVGLVALWFLWKHRFWPDSVAMLLAGIGGFFLINFLKGLFHRSRPEAIFYHLGYSFPSGHSFFAVVVYGMIAYFLSRDAPRTKRFWIWTAAVFAMLLMGFSRVYLLQHYPTDVAGGYLAGLAWLWGCTALPEIWGKRSSPPADTDASFERIQPAEGTTKHGNISA